MNPLARAPGAQDLAHCDIKLFGKYMERRERITGPTGDGLAAANCKAPGSVARGQEQAMSDVDLMVIGRAVSPTCLRRSGRRKSDSEERSTSLDILRKSSGRSLNRAITALPPCCGGASG